MFDSGVPLSRLKEEKGKISKVSEGRSLLQLVAASGCPEKGAFLIEKIMNAKNRFDKTNNGKKICEAGCCYKEKVIVECDLDHNDCSARLLVLI